MVDLFTPTAILIARIIIGLLLLISGLLKLPDLKGFSSIIVQYGLFKQYSVKIARAYPFLEIFIGLFVLSGYYMFYSSLFALVLILLASFFVVYALYKKIKVDNCGCYGTLVNVPVSYKKLLENFVWIAIAFYLFLSSVKFIFH